MSFGFGNTANTLGGAAAGAGEASVGPDLETIQTEGLGFLPLAGEAKVRLASPWSSLPAPTSSLLSIASRRGLVAAAGPDQVIIATTESVRKAFSSPKEGDSEVRAFEPQLKIPMPMRISHLAFTADENYLILSAESGGGLAVYEVQSLLQGSSNSAFELPTNGESLWYLAPNPVAEKAELCAIVTSNGNLYMANFNERKLSNPLKTQVSCLSWSAKGKQLCAGMADGTISQMTPDGEGKGNITKPPNLGDCHVSSLTWLENNLFLTIHRTRNESPPSSIYHIIIRQPPSSFTFQKLTDPVEPFGAEKPPHHAILRLRDFLNLQELLIVSSTASTEVGILTRSKTPLANDKPADSITNVFTTTEFLEDTRRPTLPMTESMDDSVTIGVALDLSSKDQVYKPIPSDEELDHSQGPLPGFWALTHEGVLCSWWLVYNEAVKKGQNYPGLAMMDSTAQPATTSTPVAPAISASPFAAASSTPFGSSTTPTAAPAFGSSSQLGQKSSLWGAPTTTPITSTGGATFGSSTFGSSPSGTGSAFGKTNSLGFGQSSQLGMRTSPWASGTGSKPAFGQSSFSSFANGGNNQSPFGPATSTSNTPNAAASTAPSTGGGFSAFSSQGGFSSLSGNNSSSSGFGKGSTFGASAFGTPAKSNISADTAFPAKQDKPLANPFASSTPFKLESSFKPDPVQKDSNEKPSATFGGSMFGSAFGSALGDAAASKPGEATPSTKDEDMDTAETTEETPQSKPQSIFAPQQPQESTTPTTTPGPSRFSFATTSTPGTSLFGPATKTETPSTGLFGTPKDTPKPGGFSLFGSSKATDSSVEKSKVKSEEQDSPLPPDTTSKAAYPVGGSSSSSAASNSSQLFGSTTTPLKPDSTLSSSDSTTPKPSFTQIHVSLPSVFPNILKQTQPSSTPDVEKVTEPVENPTVIEDAPLPPDFTKKPSIQTSLPADSTKAPATTQDLDAPAAAGFVLPKAPSKEPSSIPSLPETTDDDETDIGEDEVSEGSGVDVAKDLSPITSGPNVTPGFTPQSSFGGIAGATPTTARPEDRARPLFGEIGLSRGAPVLPKPSQASPRSPSPVRGAVPQRLIRSDATRSVSAPGMASQILGPKQSQMHHSSSIISSREKQPRSEDPFMLQHRRMRERQEAEETQPLVDEEDEEMQKVLSSQVEGTLQLDEFIAHSNVAPPAKESVPSQVEAVYRDINSMIDTLGLNARAVKAFTKGHTDNAAENGRSKQDLEIPDDWVLCEINELGEVLDNELHADLENGRVQDLDDKLDACQDLSRDMQRLRAKQEDLKRIIMTRMDPEQTERARMSPLSAEQAAQQNELRREFTNFTKLLAEAEEALTLLKTRIAATSSPSGRGSTNVPTVEAIMRTISKMTSMAEKRSGDIDVLETQLRKMRLESTSREASPMVTPQARKSIMMSPDATPSRNFRQSLTMSSGVMSLHAATKGTPPRKKLSGFSKDEKSDLMEKRARRQAVLSKLKDSVGKRGVNVWNMEDIE